ncbi:protein GDAP2 homolog isoform X4 [Contarinia nasturtii]|uniref:protein GDAP2 homolog isoform X4 n=1 Tax=Contarinia nasturtii TaxID=265458 RepID=UPI0012D37723|nr:protein GDAP2 homolog isoform X4 [Contarinia nasturtii]
MSIEMRLVTNTLSECYEPFIIPPISIQSLSRWDKHNDFHVKPTDYSALEGPRHRASPFPRSDQINSRFIIWEGDISLIESDVITNTTDETLTEKNSISSRIFQRAGPSLYEEILNDNRECKTGEVRVTKGYNLSAKYIIHTVGPIYTERYKTAAEQTLYSCYRNILSKSRELGAKSLAICVVSTVQKNFPPDIGAHIALRTIRRFLDTFQNETIILCLEPHERGIYEVLAPLYFPRDILEESSALWQLPRDIGGKFGEPQIFDRQIRIIHNPQHSVMINADDDSDTNPRDLDSVDIEYGLSSHLNIGQHSFSQMQGDLDRQRLLGNRQRVGLYENSNIDAGDCEGLEHQERLPLLMETEYERLLRRARTEDLTEVSGIGCLYQSGVDRLGRPVVVFCGKWFPAHNIDLEKALLYLIYLLDPIVKGDYVIAYFHTLTNSNNYPSLHWLKEVYSILPYKYKKNLKAFYIVHPTFWTRMMTWWFLTFMAPAIKSKVHQLPGVEHLYAVMTRDQLEIPAYITEYDMATNGLHYFQPITRQTPEL